MDFCTLDPLFEQLRYKYAGSKIKLRRAELAISDNFLANAIGIDVKELLSYENGEQDMPFDVAYRISKVLHTDFNYYYNGFEQTFS